MLSLHLRHSLQRKGISKIVLTRQFNFASSQYNAAVHLSKRQADAGDRLHPNLPTPNFDQLRRAALSYMDNFDKKIWHERPIASVVNGERLEDGENIPSMDAFGNVNGGIKHCNDQELGSIIRHINSVKPKKKDYRQEIRKVEKKLFEEYSGELIGNQALDFWKQDGVTEIEESLLANPVEWQMNDDLLQAETDGKLKINRAPAFVACVSNFSNFLDLFRKTLRNLELGVPVVVLSRTNTSQHCFRWFEILLDLIKEETNISPGMLTFASVHPDNIQHIFDSVSDDCPMLMTCSRDLAKLVKKGKSNVIASTGGPNTLVTNNLDAISDAVKVSAGIENSGQCTAMRHVVVGGINHNNSNILDGNHVSSLFDTIDVVEGPGKSLMEGKFAGVFEDAPFFPGGLPRGYVAHEKVDMAYKVNEPGELPPKNIDEHWRRVVLDFSQKSDGSAIKAKDDFTDKLATWLVENQPISVAVNDDGNYDLLKYIWERTGGVVYTGGSIENPALTCQARPQEGEIFGEFPVRKDLRQYSKFPVVVPSPTAAYNATYREEYLLRKRGESLPDYVKNYIKSCEDDVYKGYLMEMGEYLLDATMDGPRHGCGERTALWGLQRPPVDGAPTVFKVKDDVKNFDELSVKLLPFFMTNARKSAVVVVEGGDKNGDLSKKLQKAGVTDKMDVRFKKFLGEEFFNEVVIGKAGEEIELAMVGQFVSLYLCVGHVKSTKGGDEEFIKAFSGSEKWLRVNKQ